MKPAKRIVALALVAGFALSAEFLLFPSAVAAIQSTSAPVLIDVRSYGAKCDGNTDDRLAFAAAITAGGAYPVPVRIYVPDSMVCLVGSNPSPGGYVFVIPYTNIGFTGSGTLKIGNSFGNYRVLFDWSQPATNITIENLTIDGNATNNEVNSSPLGANEHIAFQVNGGTAKNVTVQNVKFINGNDVNTLAFNNCNDCHIRNNRWSNMGTGGTFDHDSSEIYLTGIGGEVRGNIFDAAGIGVRTAIEVHRSGKLVTGNTINGYRACILPSAGEDLARSVDITGNTCLNVYQGITVWAVDGAWDGISITGNVVRQNRNGFWGSVNWDAPIGLYPGSTYAVKNLTIANNQITTVLPDALSTNNQQAGISLYVNPATPTLANALIEGNLIEQALCSGITVQGPVTISSLVIRGNTIVNPGQTKSTGNVCAASAFQNAIGIFTATGGTITGSIVRDNYISDNQLKPTMKTGLFFYGHLGDGAATGLVFDNNNVSFSGRPITASPYAVFHGTAPDFHIRVPNYSAVMPILQGLVTSPPKSSTIFDPTIGRTYNVNAEGKIDRVPR